MSHNLPSEVVHFIAKYIYSVSMLEVLFHFYVNRNIEWSAAQISQLQNSSMASVNEILSFLRSKNFILEVKNKNYRYKNVGEQTDQTIHLVYKSYQQKPVAVIGCIYSKEHLTKIDSTQLKNGNGRDD